MTSILIAIAGTFHFGYRDISFVVIVLCSALLLAFLGHFAVGILFPPQLVRFKKNGWFTYDHRYSPAIWTVSFAMGVVIAFSLGYYKEDSLRHNAMFFFVVLCVTNLLGYFGNFLFGILIPLPPNQVKGEPFNSEGSLSLTEKSETKKNVNP